MVYRSQTLLSADNQTLADFWVSEMAGRAGAKIQTEKLIFRRRRTFSVSTIVGPEMHLNLQTARAKQKMHIRLFWSFLWWWHWSAGGRKANSKSYTDIFSFSSGSQAYDDDAEGLNSGSQTANPKQNLGKLHVCLLCRMVWSGTKGGATSGSQRPVQHKATNQMAESPIAEGRDLRDSQRAKSQSRVRKRKAWETLGMQMEAGQKTRNLGSTF